MLVRDTIWAALAAIILSAGRIGLSAIAARRLSQAEFGQFAYAQWLVDIVFLACSLGAPGVASRYVAEDRGRPARLAALLVRWRVFAYTLPLIAGGVAFVAARALYPDSSGLMLAMLALWASGYGFWAMQTAVLIGLQRFDLICRANVLACAMMLGGALGLPLNSDGVAFMCGLMGVTCCVTTMVGFSHTRRLITDPIRTIDSNRWRSIRSYAVNIWITALLSSLVWSRGEMPIVRAYLGDGGVAQYAVAMIALGGAIQAVMLGVWSMAPNLTVLWGSDKREEAIAAARTGMDVQLLVCGAVAMLLICLGPELVRLGFGSSYREASSLLAIFAIGLLALAASCQSHLLQIATDAKFTRNTTMLGLLLLGGSAIVLIPLYGLNGAATARSGSTVCLALLTLLVSVRRWGAASVSWRNVLIVFTLVGGSGIAIAAFGDIGMLIRLALLAIALLVLGLSIRDRHGLLLSITIWRAVMRSRLSGGGS